MKRLLLLLMLSLPGLAQNVPTSPFQCYLFPPQPAQAKLNLTYNGGLVNSGSLVFTVVSGSIGLTAFATNYIYANPNTQTVQASTSSFLSGAYPMCTAVTNGTMITALTDQRPNFIVSSGSSNVGTAGETAWYSTTSSILSGNPDLLFSSTTENLSLDTSVSATGSGPSLNIGTLVANPVNQTALVLNGSPLSTSSPAYATELEIHNAFASGIRVFTHNNGTAFRSPQLYFYTSAGTQASPSAVGFLGFEENPMGQLNSCGYNGSAYACQASINFFSDNAWTTSAMGVSIHFYTTNPSSLNSQERFQIGGLDPNGNNNPSIITYLPICFGGTDSSHACVRQSAANVFTFNAGPNTNPTKLIAGSYQSASGLLSLSGCSASSPLGGSAGQFVSGTSGTCTVTLTFAGGGTGTAAASNGFACWANDVTTTTDTMKQTASSTTGATLSGTTVSGDTIVFGCLGY